MDVDGNLPYCVGGNVLQRLRLCRYPLMTVFRRAICLHGGSGIMEHAMVIVSPLGSGALAL